MSDLKYTSDFIKRHLLYKFGPPSHAFFTEVRDSTGAYGSRYADAIAVDLYPSAGFVLQGFEIKISRADFLNEMKQPEKSNAVLQYCDRWWLVCPKGIVLPDEIPSTWGLMEIVQDSFYIKKKAPKLKPLAWDKGFIASLLRHATQNFVPRSTVETMRSELLESAREAVKSETEHERSEKERLEKIIKDFETASGFHIKDWSHTPEQVGKAVRIVLNGGFRNVRVDYEINKLKNIVKELENYNANARYLEERFDVDLKPKGILQEVDYNLKRN